MRRRRGITTRQEQLTTRTEIPQVDKEMSDLGGVRKVRFGLAAKFTIPVSIVLAIAIVLMGFVVYGKTSDSLKLQLTAQGVFAARIAAAPEVDSWDPDYNTHLNLTRRVDRIQAELALAGAATRESTSPEMTPEKVKELRAAVKKHDASQRFYNKKRLARIIRTATRGPGIYLDLKILPEGGRWVTASGENKGKHSGRPGTTATSPETEIFIGTYPVGDRNDPARFFYHPIKDKDDVTVGKAVVVFSERQIGNDLAELRSSIIIFCILGVLITAGVAFFTSRVFTRPLGHLMKDIKTVAGGNLQHRTRPRSHDEIGSVAFAFDHMTQNLAAAEVMRVDLADKEHQVSLAQEVQERLFPQALPNVGGMTLDAKNRLAGDLSADYFDAVQLEDGRVALLAMTASGRGVPAAIVLSMARSLFHAVGVQKSSPGEALRAINQLLSQDLRRGMYVSALYAIVDPATGSGSLASAGHRVPALQFVSASSGIRKLQADGIAIGLDKGPVFDRSLTETGFTLDSGDRLVLATEGAFLLQDADGEALGEDAFLRVVLACCKKGVAVDAILSTLENRLGAHPGDHDITVVMASRDA
ncbi:MAG: SpoIIE family protein phosphatase [Planctomycetes bacterium]|nr:SpoIIE family protein phosphatase [Planctomycetota bacterium]